SEFPCNEQGDFLNPCDGRPNKKGEMNFVQISGVFAKEDHEVVAPPLSDFREYQGVNTLEEQKLAGQYRRELEAEAVEAIKSAPATWKVVEILTTQNVSLAVAKALVERFGLESSRQIAARLQDFLYGDKAKHILRLIDEDVQNLQAVQAVQRAWDCIKGNIEHFDAAVAEKKESFLSRFYHAMARTFENITAKAKEGRIDPFLRVNLLKYSKEEEEIPLHDAEREIKIGFFPIAANPLNWGHILPPLMSMNALELDTIILRVQGEISYKKLLACERVSVKDRHFTVNEAIKGLYPLVRYTDLGSEENNEREGSDEMHRFLKLNAERKIHLYYLIGAEDEQRMWNYMRQQYEFFGKYNFGINPNHRVTFAVMQRDEYGATVTLKDLEDISRQVQKEFGQKQFLNIALVQDPDIDLHVSSTYYRNTQDGAFVPKIVHDFAKSYG
ncbi:unnamed protein product, partial [marine sediment metagenome]